MQNKKLQLSSLQYNALQKPQQSSSPTSTLLLQMHNEAEEETLINKNSNHGYLDNLERGDVWPENQDLENTVTSVPLNTCSSTNITQNNSNKQPDSIKEAINSYNEILKKSNTAIITAGYTK